MGTRQAKDLAVKPSQSQLAFDLFLWRSNTNHNTGSEVTLLRNVYQKKKRQRG